MGCCYGCLGEAEKVERVLEKFPAVPVSRAEEGSVQRLVGHCVLAGTKPYYSPIYNKPCVYFRLVVEEECSNNDGGSNWVTRVDTEFSVDFFIQDGIHKVFIKGSDRSHCRVSSEFSDFSTNSGFFSNSDPPEGVRRFLANDGKSGGWWNSNNSYRYRECVFEVNEKLSCLGFVTTGVDPFTGVPVKVLNPISENSITKKYMEDNEWGDWTKQAWEDMTSEPSVLCTDKHFLTYGPIHGIEVQPVQNLPAWQTSFQDNYWQIHGENAYAPPSYEQAAQQPSVQYAAPGFTNVPPQGYAPPQQQVNGFHQVYAPPPPQQGYVAPPPPQQGYVAPPPQQGYVPQQQGAHQIYTAE